MTNHIVKTIVLKATSSRVWQAIADHEQFGQWFRVALDGPFQPGTLSTGRITYPGYEGYAWLAEIATMEPERLFAFRWFHAEEGAGPATIEQPATRVEFRLEPVAEGTRLTITESGFDALPDPWRLEILRGNEEGWEIQAGNLAAYVGALE